MKERILKIMEREQMSPSRFAEEIGIQRSALSHILNDRNKASLEVLMKILGRFDYLNTDWLLMGKGAMAHSDKTAFESGSLFGEDTKITPAPPAERKYEREEEIRKPVQREKVIEKEVVIVKNPPLRAVSKIVVFYSDSTFDNFVPERVEK